MPSLRLLLPCCFALLVILASFASAAEEPARKRIALIFDDGPVPGTTKRLLKTLEEEGIKVTFGYMGRKVDEAPELARAAAEAGHELVNHSYSHPRMPKLPDDKVRRQATRATEAIEKASGEEIRWFWPPHFQSDKRVAAIIAETGLQVYPAPRSHRVSTRDWNVKLSREQIRKRATNNVKDGTVIVFHEWRQETLAELPAIVADLREQGCEFLTFSELADLELWR